MKRGMAWFPVHLEVLATLELSRASHEAIGLWVRLVAIAAARETGGRITGMSGWTRTDLVRVVGPATTHAAIDRAAAAGLVRWDGTDLVIVHYPEDAELALRKQRAGGSDRSSPGPVDDLETPLSTSSRRPAPPSEKAESLNFDLTQGGTQGGGSKSKRESKREISSGPSLRDVPDPRGAEDEFGSGPEGQLTLAGIPTPTGPLPPRKPRPWERMLDAFARGAGARWIAAEFDLRLAIPLGVVAKLVYAKHSDADIEAAGMYVARNFPGPVGASWLAKGGKLSEAIARAKGSGSGLVVLSGGLAPPRIDPRTGALVEELPDGFVKITTPERHSDPSANERPLGAGTDRAG